MSPEESALRVRFRHEYGSCVDEFYRRLQLENLTEEELGAVPALFLPGCGNLYAQSLVKVALIGEGTNYWRDSLLADLEEREQGRYNLEFSFEVLQRESAEVPGRLCDGPTKWRNPFWKSLAEVLNVVYATHNALDGGSSIFRGIAWGNSYPIEQYKPDGIGGGVAKGSISPARLSGIHRIADDCGLSSLEKFIRVFKPNVIIYTLHNSSGSDRVFPKGIERIGLPEHPVCGSPWVIKTYRYEKTLIIQTQHPSWVTGRKHIAIETYGIELANVLIRNKVFAPPAKEHFYWNLDDSCSSVFSDLLNSEATRLGETGEAGDKRTMSYKLVLALADHLRLTNSTMTAVLMVRLLNTVRRFREEGWVYSPDRRGPCAVAAAAWRYYQYTRKDTIAAAKIAEAFTKMDGRYAYC